jgi:hydrogenase maturation protease
VTNDVLIIAVGNAWRSDDGAGPELGLRLRRTGIRNAHVAEAAGSVDLLTLWGPEDDVIIVDAVVSGSRPGAVICRDAVALRLPREWFRLSSHQLGVADAIELARALGRLPRTLVFVGIEAERLDDGMGLSRRIQAALPAAIRAVRTEVRRLRRRARRRLHRRSRECARQSEAPAHA